MKYTASLDLNEIRGIMNRHGPAGWNGKAPEPFSISVPESVLDDLKQRLARISWPDEIPGEAWRYGTDLRYLKELCAYWQDTYEWRRHESHLNQFESHIVEIDGIKLHYVHERGEGNHPRPLLLTHGWPGSFYEYHQLIHG
jgi:hypothetical protein